MRIFITGGTGFIGKSVIAELVGKKHSLLVLTRKSTLINLGADVEIVNGDLGNILGWIDEVKKFKPDTVIHLAWEGIPDFSLEQCQKNISQNISLFNALGTLSIKRLIVSGSCFEYGANKTGALPEDTPPGELNMFSTSKRTIHTTGKEIAKKCGYEFIWTRLFYVYGPGQRKESLIPSLINAMQKKLPSPIKNPNAANDFIFVADVARALVQLALAKTLPYDTFNIGSGSLTAIQYISDIIHGLHTQRHKTNPGFCGNINNMKKIGWEPTTPIENGVSSTIQAFKVYAK